MITKSSTRGYGKVDPDRKIKEVIPEKRKMLRKNRKRRRRRRREIMKDREKKKD